MLLNGRPGAGYYSIVGDSDAAHAHRHGCSGQGLKLMVGARRLHVFSTGKLALTLIPSTRHMALARSYLTRPSSIVCIAIHDTARR
jgi:hypothetical protein